MKLKVRRLLHTIVNNTPGMGYFEVQEKGTFESERKLLWDWFHVSIDKAVGLKCGAYIYAYESSLEFKLPEADYDLAVSDSVCNGEYVKLYYLG